MSLYGSSLWHNYNSYSIRRLRIAYNDAFRMIHGPPVIPVPVSSKFFLMYIPLMLLYVSHFLASLNAVVHRLIFGLMR